MTDITKEELPPEIPKDNIVQIDDLKIERMAQIGVYWNIFDSWNTLEVRIGYGEQLTPLEAREYCLLTKYMLKYGHSEAIQIKCKHIFNRYMKDQGL